MTKVKSILSLTPTAYNPRVADERTHAALAYSIETFGDISGIVFNTQLDALVTGHQRVAALKAKWGTDIPLKPDGLHIPTGEVIPVRFVDWPKKLHDAALITANNPGLAGEWSQEAVDIIGEIETDQPELYEMLKMDDPDLWGSLQRAVQEDRTNEEADAETGAETYVPPNDHQTERVQGSTEYQSFTAGPKQLIFVYSSENYPRIVERLNAVMEKESLNSHTEVLERLLSDYESN